MSINVCFNLPQADKVTKVCEPIGDASFKDLDENVVNLEEAALTRQAFDKLTQAGKINLGAVVDQSKITVTIGKVTKTIQDITSTANFKPSGASMAAKSEDQAALLKNIAQTWRGHLATALHNGLENMQPDMKSAIEKTYAKDGIFDEAKFLSDFYAKALKELKGLDWEDILQDDSSAEADNFELEDVNDKLDVGKDIVVGAVFVKGSKEKLIDILSNPQNFTQYDGYMGTGIKEAKKCAGSNITIRFGGGVAGSDAVRVVNENRNRLAAQGIQYWRLAKPEPAGCPKIHDIATNIGVQSIFPYKDGYVVVYLLLSTPSTQVGANPAMENTLDSIESLSEKP